MTSFFDTPSAYAPRVAALTVMGVSAPDRLAPLPSVRSFSPNRERTMGGLELFFDILLAVMSIVIVWFAAFSVMKLYQGQR
ncbi:hypothetical protein [Streptomyces tateyamensis]|uniref:hypothetical protein n=1 Tax=Streptomyces tateyamensis TaxID=565073 RepID=UPI0011B72085|nr:hypothetical protein [Streptomyces tateyamensis]